MPTDFFGRVMVVFQRYGMSMLQGAGVSLRIALVGTIVGCIIGFAVGIVQTIPVEAKDNPIKKGVLWVIKLIMNAYVEFFRGTPMMVQLMIMYFVVFSSSRHEVAVATLAFGINSGAYVAEIVRGGIMSVDAGQMEAGRSLGMNYTQTMRHIIIPQAIKNILPALGNEMITLLKDTSLMTVIGAKDLTKAAQTVQAVTYQAFMPYISIAVVYLVCVIALSKLLALIERRMRNSDRR